MKFVIKHGDDAAASGTCEARLLRRLKQLGRRRVIRLLVDVTAEDEVQRGDSDDDALVVAVSAIVMPLAVSA